MKLIGTRTHLFVKLSVVAVALGFGIYCIGLAAEQPVGARSIGPEDGYTAAPAEFDCTVCHFSFPVNSGSGSLRISGVPRTYQPNQIIPITVTLKHPGAAIMGFQLTAADDEGHNAGTMTLLDPGSTQLQNFNNGNFPRVYVEHVLAGTVPSPSGQRSWTFNWTAPNSSPGANVAGRRVTFYAAGNAGNGNSNIDGDYIYTTRARTGSVRADFNGDGESDIGVFRPSNSGWFVYNRYDGSLRVNLAFGATDDIPVPGDYDGDNKTDVAIYRPSVGGWYIFNSSTNSVSGVNWGAVGDVPVAGDYDADGKTDVTVYRPSTGAWYWVRSSDNEVRGVGFGIATDRPVPEDYDGDGLTDIAIYRPSTGVWYFLIGPNYDFSAQFFGLAEDAPVQGDYDGDGKADVAVWRRSTGFWYIQNSSNGALVQHQLGGGQDIPAPLFYDSDSRMDFAVFHPDGTWEVDPTAGGHVTLSFGLPGDIPLPFKYLY